MSMPASVEPRLPACYPINLLANWPSNISNPLPYSIFSSRSHLPCSLFSILFHQFFSPDWFCQTNHHNHANFRLKTGISGLYFINNPYMCGVQARFSNSFLYSFLRLSSPGKSLLGAIFFAFPDLQLTHYELLSFIRFFPFRKKVPFIPRLTLPALIPTLLNYKLSFDIPHPPPPSQDTSSKFDTQTTAWQPKLDIFTIHCSLFSVLFFPELF